MKLVPIAFAAMLIVVSVTAANGPRKSADGADFPDANPKPFVLPSVELQ